MELVDDQDKMLLLPRANDLALAVRLTVGAGNAAAIVISSTAKLRLDPLVGYSI